MKAIVELEKARFSHALVYTGSIRFLDNNLIRIDTIKDEIKIFRREQIQEITITEDDEEDNW